MIEQCRMEVPLLMPQEQSWNRKGSCLHSPSICSCCQGPSLRSCGAEVHTAEEIQARPGYVSSLKGPDSTRSCPAWA